MPNISPPTGGTGVANVGEGAKFLDVLVFVDWVVFLLPVDILDEATCGGC